MSVSSSMSRVTRRSSSIVRVYELSKSGSEALQTQGGKLVLAKDWIEKWDGHLPTVQSGSGMIIDVRELLDVKGDKKK